MIAWTIDFRHHALFQKTEIKYHIGLFARLMQMLSNTGRFNGVAMTVQMAAFRTMRHDPVTGINTNLPCDGIGRYQRLILDSRETDDFVRLQ